MAIEMLKRHKSSGINQIPAELIRYVIHKLLISIWNREELPEEWKETIVVPIYKKGDNTNCSNYKDISLLPTTYKILSNILLSRLTPYAEEIIGDHQCGFRRNRSANGHIFCIRQILEKKKGMQGNSASSVYRLQETYNSVRREVLYNILIDCCIPMKLIRLIKLCLIETYSRVRVGKNLSDMFLLGMV